MQTSECVHTGLVVHVGVNLQGGTDTGMTEDGLRITGLNVQCLEQGCHSVTDVVDLDDPDAVVQADTAERPDKVTRFDRPSGAGCEGEASRWPCRAHIGPVGGLAFGLDPQCLPGGIEQRQASFPGTGLDRADDQFTPHALELLMHLDRARTEINVRPSQAEHLATPQPVRPALSRPV
jgi:hypothetical protein